MPISPFNEEALSFARRGADNATLSAAARATCREALRLHAKLAGSLDPETEARINALMGLSSAPRARTGTVRTLGGFSTEFVDLSPEAAKSRLDELIGAGHAR